MSPGPEGQFLLLPYCVKDPSRGAQSLCKFCDPEAEGVFPDPLPAARGLLPRAEGADHCLV